jgi:hypothetical protein
MYGMEKKMCRILPLIGGVLGLAAAVSTAFSAPDKFKRCGYELVVNNQSDWVEHTVSKLHNNEVFLIRKGANRGEAWTIYTHAFRFPETVTKANLKKLMQAVIERDEESKRVTLKTHTIRSFKFRDMECMRYLAIAEDRPDRKKSGAFGSMILLSSNVLCSVPKQPRAMFNFLFSQHAYHPTLKAFKQQAQKALDNVQFNACKISKQNGKG